MRKLKAIFHILFAKKFLCFTYIKHPIIAENETKWYADYFFTDESKDLDRYFFDQADPIYKNRKETTKTMIGNYE